MSVRLRCDVGLISLCLFYIYLFSLWFNLFASVRFRCDVASISLWVCGVRCVCCLLLVRFLYEFASMSLWSRDVRCVFCCCWFRCDSVAISLWFHCDVVNPVVFFLLIPVRYRFGFPVISWIVLCLWCRCDFVVILHRCRCVSIIFVVIAFCSISVRYRDDVAWFRCDFMNFVVILFLLSSVRFRWVRLDFATVSWCSLWFHSCLVSVRFRCDFASACCYFMIFVVSLWLCCGFDVMRKSKRNRTATL